jgi:arylsulfatase A-like enzyme
MNCLVVSLGGVNARLLSCYGNAAIDTPAIDQFAADGFVFDQCFADTIGLVAARRALWTGRFQSAAGQADDDLASAQARESLLPLSPSGFLEERAGAAGFGLRAVLIRDTKDLVRSDRLPVRMFDQVVDCDPATGELFASVRRLFGSAGDAPLLASVDSWGIHPPHNQDVAATVARLDQHVGELFDWLREQRLWDQTMILLTSDVGSVPRDQPEANGGLDVCDGAHVPLIVRIPGAHDPATRTPALVQTVDLLPTILDVMQRPAASDSDGRSLLPVIRLTQRNVRDHVLVAAPHARWLRTSQWSLMLPTSNAADPSGARLFAQPEDYWERNDLASQFPDVVAELGDRGQESGVTLLLTPDS